MDFSSTVATGGEAARALKHKRRFCKMKGCDRIIKSQGLCQRHGAKPRKCKIGGCEKQAQGSFDGMCKSHFKNSKMGGHPMPPPPADNADPPAPSGESVYDRIIPDSIAWGPRGGSHMPLIAHLKNGFDTGKPPAWHRNEERLARGYWPVTSPAAQLEGWERELVWTEILILTGNAQTSFRHLARAWGRDKGFQTVLAQFICERKGDVERKVKAPRSTETPSICVEINPEQPPSVVDIKTNEDMVDENVEQNHTESTTSSVTTAEEVSCDIWDESYYFDMAHNEELATDLFSFAPGHANRFASFQFDSATLAMLDRDAEAIMSDSEGDGEENDAKRAAL